MTSKTAYLASLHLYDEAVFQGLCMHIRLAMVRIILRLQDRKMLKDFKCNYQLLKTPQNYPKNQHQRQFLVTFLWCSSQTVNPDSLLPRLSSNIPPHSKWPPQEDWFWWKSDLAPGPLLIYWCWEEAGTCLAHMITTTEHMFPCKPRPYSAWCQSPKILRKGSLSRLPSPCLSRLPSPCLWPVCLLSVI